MPGARLGRGFCEAKRNPLKSSSVTVNGRPDWNVPTPESCQPSVHRLARERQLPHPAQDQSMAPIEIGPRPVQLGPALVVLDLKDTLVREGVHGLRERVVDVEHVAATEPALQAQLQRVIVRAATVAQEVRAFVFVEAEQRAAQLAGNHAVARIVLDRSPAAACRGSRTRRRRCRSSCR